MHTKYSNDFSNWEISGSGKTVKVTTSYSNDFTKWNVSGDASGSMSTNYPNYFSSWNINVNFNNLPDEMKYAIVFVVIQTSFSQQK